MTPPSYSYVSTKGEVGQAWGDWLSGLARWQWWFTGTFRPIEPRYREYEERSGVLYQGETKTVLDCPGNDKPGWARARGAWGELVARLQPALGPLVWTRGFEVQPWRGVPHVHALIAGLDDPRYAPVGLWWWKRYGLCHIEEYNPELGAGYYLCKYVSKPLAELDFGGLTSGKARSSFPSFKAEARLLTTGLGSDSLYSRG